MERVEKKGINFIIGFRNIPFLVNGITPTLLCWGGLSFQGNLHLGVFLWYIDDGCGLLRDDSFYKFMFCVCYYC